MFKSVFLLLDPNLVGLNHSSVNLKQLIALYINAILPC